MSDYNHPDHTHTLKALKIVQEGEIECKGCERLITEPFHGCLDCEYYIHDECMRAQSWIEHPSHPKHHLTLFIKPSNPTRSYTCNACGLDGQAFGFTCALCQFNLHLDCATLPATVLLEVHHHELSLTFEYPRKKKEMFYCGICWNAIEQKQWMHNCDACQFRVHLDCAKPNNWASANSKSGAIGLPSTKPRKRDKLLPGMNHGSAAVGLVTGVGDMGNWVGKLASGT